MSELTQRMDSQVKKARKQYFDEKEVLFTNSEGRPSNNRDELLEWMDFDENKDRIEAEIYALALATMGVISNQIGKVIMVTMWEVFEKGLYLKMGENASVEEWATSNMEGYDTDHDYIKSIARSVDCILSWVYQYEKAEDFLMTEDGKRIVVVGTDDEEGEVNLISGKGFVSKLKENATFFAGIDDKKKQEKFIKMLATESRRHLQAQKAKMKNKDVKDNLNGIKVSLTMKEKGDKIIVTIPSQKIVLSHQSYKAFVTKFSNYLDIPE